MEIGILIILEYFLRSLVGILFVPIYFLRFNILIMSLTSSGNVRVKKVFLWWTCKLTCVVFRCMNNVRFYLFGSVVKNMLKKLLRTKRVYFFGIVYIETINRIVFGGIYINNRFYILPRLKHILIMLLEKNLIVICFRISNKNVYEVSIAFEFVA